MIKPLFGDVGKPAKSQAVLVINDNQIEQLGLVHTSHFQQTSKNLLEAVKLSDTGQFGTQLNSLIGEAKKLDPAKFGKPGIVGKIMNLFSSSKERMMSEYQSIQGRMDTLISELDKSSSLHVKRIDDLERMSQENFSAHENLRLSALEGHKYLEVLNKQLEEAKIDTDSFESQRNISLIQNKIDRLEKRIDDINRSMLLAKMAEPQIRMLQQNARTLASKLVDIKTTTIPAWRQAFTMYIIQDEQKKSTEMANKVQDATDQALQLGAKMFREGATEVAKLSQRSTISIETLEKIQHDLIGTFDDVVQIELEGKKSRQEAEKKLLELESQLKDKFVRK